MQLERMKCELEQHNERLAETAVTDELTGLKNRRRFMEVLETSFAFAVRQEQPLSLVMLDVDHFKLYNDGFGHPAGDEVLCNVAEALSSTSRSYDLVARYGGEEFAILLPGADLDASRGTCRTDAGVDCSVSLAITSRDGQPRRRHSLS